MKRKTRRHSILISNDDGIYSPGLRSLAASLKRLGKVTVVAPDRERSAASHSLTLHRPLRINRISPGFYSVDGTPTDCVTLAVHAVMKKRPDIVVSGINHGPNLGEDVVYSGTVSAAMEGTLLGIPSVAFSLEGSDGFDFTPAARFAAKLVRYILDSGLPEDTLLNVNIPGGKKIKGYRITRQGRRYFNDVVVEKIDPRGKKYYWIGGDMDRWEGGRDCDFYALSRGYISITPVHLDMTNYSAMEKLKNWRFSL